MTIGEFRERLTWQGFRTDTAVFGYFVRGCPESVVLRTDDGTLRYIAGPLGFAVYEPGTDVLRREGRLVAIWKA